MFSERVKGKEKSAIELNDSERKPFTERAPDAKKKTINIQQLQQFQDQIQSQNKLQQQEEKGQENVMGDDEMELMSQRDMLMKQDENMIQSQNINGSQIDGLDTNKLFVPIHLDQFIDLPEEPGLMSNYLQEKTKKNIFQSQQGKDRELSTFHDGKEGNADLKYLKIQIRNRKKFIGFNLLGAIIAIILGFGYYNYQENDESKSSIFIYVNLTIQGVLLGAVQVIWIQSLVNIQLSNYSENEKQDQFLHKEFYRRIYVLFSIIMLMSVGLQYAYGNLIFQNKIQKTVFSLFFFYWIVIVINFIICFAYFTTFIKITKHQTSRKNKDPFNLDLFTEVDSVIFKEFLKSQQQKKQELKNQIKDKLQLNQRINKHLPRSATKFGLTNQVSGRLRSETNIGETDKNYAKMIQSLSGYAHQIDEEEKFINPMINTGLIIKLCFSLLVEIASICVGFYWGDIYNSILKNNRAEWMLVLAYLGFPIMAFFIALVSSFFLPKNMKMQSRVKSYTFMAITYRYSFLILSYNKTASITLLATKFCWKIFRFLLFPNFLKKITNKIQIKIGVKNKEDSKNWKELEINQKQEEKEKTYLIQKFFYLQAVDVSNAITILGLILIMKGVLDSKQINILLPDEQFDNFYIFFLIDIVADIFAFGIITCILKSRDFYQSSLQIYDNFNEKINVAKGNIGFFQIISDQLFAFGSFALILLHGFEI